MNEHARRMPTERMVRRRLYWYFREMLRLLPAEVSLSVEHPDLPHANFRPGITMHVGEDESLPEYFDICYWLLGCAPEFADRYFEDVVRIWRDLGWPLESDGAGAPRTTGARSGDGYGFSIAQSATGYLSLSGVTPLFRAESVRAHAFPPDIGHP